MEDDSGSSGIRGPVQKLEVTGFLENITGQKISLVNGQIIVLVSLCRPCAGPESSSTRLVVTAQVFAFRLLPPPVWVVLLPGPLVLTRTSVNLGSDERTTVPTFSLQTSFVPCYLSLML